MENKTLFGSIVSTINSFLTECSICFNVCRTVIVRIHTKVNCDKKLLRDFVLRGTDVSHLRIRRDALRMASGPNRAPGRYVHPESNGMPTTATSKAETCRKNTRTHGAPTVGLTALIGADTACRACRHQLDISVKTSGCVWLLQREVSER